MESVYLKTLASRLGQYRYLLVYGAGGVTQALVPLLETIARREKTYIVVSDNSGNQGEMQGYPIREIKDFCGYQEEAYVIISVMPGNMEAIEENLRRMEFRNYCRIDRLIDDLYAEIWSESKIQSNKILFSNGGGNGFGGNPKYIAMELIKSGRELDIVWDVRDENIVMPKGVRSVVRGTYEYYYELATARVWIDNQHKDVHTRKRRGQIYIQTWHGCGPLKKIEHDAPELPASYLELSEINSRMEDLAISPTSFNTQQYRRAFHYTGEILECGYPRNDIFWRENGCREKIGKLFGIKEDEGIILYAPTFRETDKEGEELDFTGMRGAMEDRFGKRFRVFARLHPIEMDSPRMDRFQDEDVINVTAYDDVQELLAAADVLITDYSSIMWDFSLQKKPVFLFHPDREHYDKERGYYLPFEKMPYMEACDNAQLRNVIARFDETTYGKRLQTFLKEYGSFDRGTSSVAVAERVLTMLDTGI